MAYGRPQRIHRTYPSNPGKRTHLSAAFGGVFKLGQSLLPCCDVQMWPSKDTAPEYGHSLCDCPYTGKQLKKIQKLIIKGRKGLKAFTNLHLFISNKYIKRGNAEERK